MKENDITEIFRQKLTNAEMPVRDGFWDELAHSLSNASPTIPHAKRNIRLRMYRVMSAASVLLLLGMTSIILWYFLPRNEMKEAFIRIEALSPTQNTIPQPNVALPQQPVSDNSLIPPITQTNSTTHSTQSTTTDKKIPLSLHMSITITRQNYTNSPRQQQEYTPTTEVYYPHANTEASSTTTINNAQSPLPVIPPESSPWSTKLFIGSALPHGYYHAPLTIGMGIERRLSDRFFLETGLRYNLLTTEDDRIHTLSIPVKVGIRLIDTSCFELYANAGGAVEKTIAGATNNSFHAQPIQLAVEAGLGISYRLNERFALLAEPTLTHHFHTDATTPTIRHARATNLTLLCGVRMTY